MGYMRQQKASNVLINELFSNETMAHFNFYCNYLPDKLIKSLIVSGPNICLKTLPSDKILRFIENKNSHIERVTNKIDSLKTRNISHNAMIKHNSSIWKIR